MSLRDHISRFADSDAGLSIILALQCATLFVVAPLAATKVGAAQWIEMLRLSLAAATIFLVARNRWIQVTIAMLFAATFVASIQWPLGPMSSSIAQPIAAAKISITLAFDVIVAAVVAFAAFSPGKVTVHRILGAIILYLYVALIFATLDRLISIYAPDAFRGLPASSGARFSELLSFSLGSLTTATTGGIVAVHPVARSLASLESVIGQLYPATLLARLVTLHASDAPSG